MTLKTQLLIILPAVCFTAAILIALKTIKPKAYMTPEPLVRPATQAGRFYESDPNLLSNEVDSFLACHAKDDTYHNVAALIVPHAGYIFSGNVAAAAYMSIASQKCYKRIFLIGPSHYEWLDGASVNIEADYYSTPLGNVEVDRETACQLISVDNVFKYQEKAHEREHCLEVQLPFLQRRFGKVPPIVPLIISTNDFSKLKRIAEVLKPYFNDDNLFIISSDFSHYPSYKDACKVDEKTGKAIMSGDVGNFITTVEDNARSGIRNLSTSACGEFPIITLMLMLNGDYEVKHLLYQNSGDMEGQDHRRVVGYHSFAILRTTGNESKQFTLSEQDKKQLREIAFKSIADAFDVTSSTFTSSARQNPALNQKCGAFVTLTKQGALRGCMGHFGEDMPLHEVVYEMAQMAAFEDPRFPQLRRHELNEIEIQISVLTPMRRIYSLDEFQLHRHGILIKKGFRSGTFLPQVADEVNWTKEEFVGHCSRDKAGLGWDGWRNAELYVYEAIVF